MGAEYVGDWPERQRVPGSKSQCGQNMDGIQIQKSFSKVFLTIAHKNRQTVEATDH